MRCGVRNSVAWLWSSACTAATFLLTDTASGQGTSPRGFEGRWVGSLALELPFRIQMSIQWTGGRLDGTIDFPDQNARGLPLTAVRVAGDSIHVVLAPANVSFDGVLSPKRDQLQGSFAQGPQRFALVLRRPSETDVRESERPQEPLPPFPYRTSEISIENRADPEVTLAGTLAVPPSNGSARPAIVLVAGSGPLDRDGTIAGHRPLAVLADFFARRGFAVLRLDKRGVGRSSGSFEKATTEDFASDVAAAVRWLKSSPGIDSLGIGLIGHSEGTLVAALVAADDPRVDFAILLAPPALPGAELMVSRARTLFAQRGIPDTTLRKDAALRRALFRELMTERDTAALRKAMQGAVARELSALEAGELAALGYSRESWDAGLETFLSQPAWFRRWLEYDPLPAYAALRCDVLAIFGGNDQQVPPSNNAGPLRKALGATTDGRQVFILPALNHLLQESASGSPAEYGRIAQTIAPAALETMERWLLARTARR